MLIRIKKGKNKESTLTCIRKDGSQTWAKIHTGIETHDIAHFVVETEMGFDKAFYGLIASGFNIKDFELPRNHRPKELLPANLSEQALQTEHIVNLLHTEANGNNNKIDYLSTLRQILQEKNIPFPRNLTDAVFQRILSKFNAHRSEWQQLTAGEYLEFTFHPASN